MEGIPVKISEKYKPPRKITLPASVQNKLNAELKLEKYDFQLERFVVDQMAKLKEQQKKIAATKSVEEKPVNMTIEDNISNTNILTPVPHKPHVQQSVINHQVVGGINISDFENDTSSPFDSVELKTLNDMEELAHVLGSTGVSQSSGKRWPENGSMSQSWAWGNNYPTQTKYPLQPPPAVHPEREAVMKPAEKVDNETMLILDNLKKHIEERKAAACLSAQKASESTAPGFPVKAGTSSEKKVEEKKREILPNPLPTLSPQSQALARRIAEMGFPLSRTARATDMFGPNEGKVIEFMLEVQSLEEAGYLGEQAERALVICKYSREDAIKFLNNMGQIMRLGFSEEDVISALIKTGLDRDKALDHLIS